MASVLQEVLQSAFIALRAYFQQRRDIVLGASKARGVRTAGPYFGSWHRHVNRQRVVRERIQTLHKEMVVRAMRSALDGWRQTIPAQLALADTHKQRRTMLHLFGVWRQRARFERDSLAVFRVEAKRRMMSAVLIRCVTSRSPMSL